MAVPESDRKANKAKQELDASVAEALGTQGAAERPAAAIASRLGPGTRLMIAGGTGAGKTELGRELSKLLQIPHLDLDLYIPSGWTPDETIYRLRMQKGLQNLWGDLPAQGGWIIEHAVAASKPLREWFQPDYVVLVTAPPARLEAVHDARSQGSLSDRKRRKARSKQTSEAASKQYQRAPGAQIAQGTTWKLKKLQ
jgi:hypothetical protein